MEVASPLPFAPATAGTKRTLACSPQLVDPAHLGGLSGSSLTDDHREHRTAKKRRFHAETSIEALAEDFSSHSLLFKNSISPSKSIFSQATVLKRSRQEPLSPSNEDLKKTVSEQAATIDSLNAEKSALESTVSLLQAENEKIGKDNQILRRAVSIQQERYKNTQNELKESHTHRALSDERIRGLEQMILTLRYHLHAQQSHVGNDFMHQPPPDVF